jgi:hypothetical protein
MVALVSILTVQVMVTVTKPLMNVLASLDGRVMAAISLIVLAVQIVITMVLVTPPTQQVLLCV